jgi:CIC family chloride channel protein
MTNGERQGEGSLLALALLARVAGVLAGLVGAIFRLCLEQADRLRDMLICGRHHRPERVRTRPGSFQIAAVQPNL